MITAKIVQTYVVTQRHYFAIVLLLDKDVALNDPKVLRLNSDEFKISDYGDARLGAKPQPSLWTVFIKYEDAFKLSKYKELFYPKRIVQVE